MSLGGVSFCQMSRRRKNSLETLEVRLWPSCVSIKNWTRIKKIKFWADFFFKKCAFTDCWPRPPCLSAFSCSSRSRRRRRRRQRSKPWATNSATTRTWRQRATATQTVQVRWCVLRRKQKTGLCYKTAYLRIKNPGSLMSNGREPKRVLDLVFSGKSGSFGS